MCMCVQKTINKLHFNDTHFQIRFFPISITEAIKYNQLDFICTKIEFSVRKIIFSSHSVLLYLVSKFFEVIFPREKKPV